MEIFLVGLGGCGVIVGTFLLLMEILRRQSLSRTYNIRIKVKKL